VVRPPLGHPSAQGRGTNIYPGADHGFDADPADPAARDAERRAADFFDAQLKR
jgi:dienelactone hydrolase